MTTPQCCCCPHMAGGSSPLVYRGNTNLVWASAWASSCRPKNNEPRKSKYHSHIYTHTSAHACENPVHQTQVSKNKTGALAMYSTMLCTCMFQCEALCIVTYIDRLQSVVQAQPLQKISITTTNSLGYEQWWSYRS